MEGKIRQIIRELRFEYELRELVREPFVADQFVEAAEFIIARNPLLGSQTEDPLVWAMPMAPIEGRAGRTLLLVRRHDRLALVHHPHFQ